MKLHPQGVLGHSHGRFRSIRKKTEGQRNIAAHAAAQVKTPPDGDQAIGEEHVDANAPKARLPADGALVGETEVHDIAASGGPHETTQM